ncbi:MAG TPA: PQQ-dependent sugar dehydrogenase [Solirubrobacterales bacterium]
MRTKTAIAIAGALAALACAAAPAGAATLEPVGRFSSPVFVTSDPNDAARLFVVERGGAIRLVAGGTTTTFLDVTTLAVSGGEQGLLSMAFAPDFAASGRFYVYYTSRPNGDIQIDEYTSDGDRADLSTRRPILTIPHRDAANHNGGQLQFGPDGYLYLATGDGGGGGDAFRNAQNTETLLGKVLRIDPLHPGGGAPYSVPSGNPFVGRAGADEVWSYGLRNPYRFSFDRQTGALLIGDVGQGSREEVDYEPQPDAGRGDNFGWSCREGLDAFPTTDPLCAGASGFTNPIHDYTHSSGGCSITGGYVARDPTLGDLTGRYVYADYCRGEIRSLVPGLPAASGDRSEGLSVSGPSSFGEDACGHLYVVSLAGPVSRFAGDTPSPCVTGGDTSPPALDAAAAKRQDVDGRIKLRLTVSEAADVTVKLAVTAGGELVAKAKKTAGFGPGETDSVGFELGKGERRRAKRAGGKLTARFTARATDASGNRGPKRKASSRLSR